jgi:hypothetical protein
MLIIILFMYSLDPMHEEPEFESQVEQAEEVNPDPEQGKPRCITR